MILTALLRCRPIHPIRPEVCEPRYTLVLVAVFVFVGLLGTKESLCK
jgi:hypothetical protein